LSESLADPDGRAYSVKLSDALTSAGGDASNAEFRRLFSADPNLSKRAFVAMLDQMIELSQTDQAAAETAAQIAAALALLINEEYKDPKPIELMTAMGEGKESSLTGLVAYLNELRPAAATAAATGLLPGNYGYDQSKASDLPPEGLNVLRPYLLKLMRLQYATAVANPELIIQELDTYAQVEEAFEQSLIALGVDAQAADMDQTQDTQRTIALKRLTVLGEIGLLDEFEKGIKELLVDDNDPLESTSILLSGFRAAFRQSRDDLAQSYLRRARELMSRPDTPSDPVLEYALRTAEYQLRRLQGFTPDQSQVSTEFDQAWSALTAYVPLTVVRHEANWYYGRLATRYWMDELAAYPDTSAIKGLKVLEQMVAWVTSIEQSGALDKMNLEGDDGLLRPDESFGAFALMVALTDQLSYVMESLPVVMESEGMLPLVGELEGLTAMFVDLQSTLGLTDEGPGFPPYDVSSGGIVPELLARCRYLEGTSVETPAADKAAKLAQAIISARQTKNPEVTVDYLLKAGRKLSALGEYDQALAAWKEALAIADELSFVQRGLDAASLLAEEFGRRQDWKNASVYAERATEKILVTAPMLGLSNPESQALAQKSQTMTAISVKAAVEADDPEKALAALTRSQQLQSAAVQMDGQKQAQAEVREVLAKEEQVVALAQEVKRLESMPASKTRNNLLESTQVLLADTRSKFLSDTRELRQKYSELYTKVLRFDPLNLPEIQKTLPPDLAVVQYFPTDDALYIFLVTQKAFRLRQVPIGQQDLEASVQAYVGAVRRQASGEARMKAEGLKLYQALIAPVKEDIAGSTTLVLIPSGRLNSLPFASLADASGVPLAQDKEILELAKSTDLMRMAGEAPKPISSLVAFANATGDLPAAGKEGEQIAALFNQSEVKLFKGKEATRDAFVKFGAQADALHLATHGEWNIEDSLGNYLAMADQQKVSQDEIFELGLDETSIVILSACNTAMGEGGDVKYVASLAEAFWIAGSRSVVASLWAVNDESTSLLMTEFYKSLKNGDGKAKALKNAQMAVRAKKEFSHPYHWAGFILFGDWR
jgi:CHAT domain-containing protein